MPSLTPEDCQNLLIESLKQGLLKDNIIKQLIKGT
ncbi:MAG: hypothetical protein HC786_20505 [Richelia sp. CSU_2_1]|nr:hypothetical protein [Richelia sp. CSU_2_1]